MVLNRPAASRQSRRCTSSASWGEGTVGPPRLRLAMVAAPTTPDPSAVVVDVADRPEDCSGERAVCRSW